MATQKNRLDPEQLAVVLIAHGSRQASANGDAVYFAEQLQKHGIARQVQAAYLELAEPTIAMAVSCCLQIRPKAVVLLPYFLSAGVHVRRDLAEMCQQLERAHPEVQFILAEPLGRHASLTSALADRLREVIG
jgi:sirohydrochlorin ferrochelatase